MKNKTVITNITVLLVLIIITANTGACVEGISQHAPDALSTASATSPAVNKTLVKFFISMGGVLLSALFIFIGLNFYKKLKTNHTPKNKNPLNEALSAPKTADEAIATCIKMNKL